MLRKAQAPPPMPPDPGMPDPAMGAAPPPMAPPMPGGMPPMPGMPAPAMPMSDAGSRPELSGPLDTLAKLLYDYDIASEISNHAAKNPEELSMSVWKAYGGDEMGNADSDKTGKRTKKQLGLPPEQQESEREMTQDSRWLRLPAGKTVADVTTLDDISEVMTGLVYGITKSKSSAGQPPPPGGMPPPMASVYRQMVRLAAAFDQYGKHARATDCDEYMDLVSRSVL